MPSVELLHKIEAARFGGYPLKASDIIDILAHLHEASITHLDLSNLMLDDPTVAAFAPSLKNTPLRHLDLSSNLFGNKGLEALALQLQETQLTTLILSNIQITGEGLKKFVPYLRETQLTTLDLTHNNLRVKYAEALAAHLPNTALKTLRIEFNPFMLWYHAFDEYRAFGAFCKSLKDTNITTLELVIRLDRLFSEQLGLGLKNTKIKTLKLRGRSLHSTNALQSLWQYLKDTCLVTLDLSYTHFDQLEAATLLQALQNSNLKSLHLYWFNPSLHGIQTIFSHIKNTALTSLDVSSVILSDPGIETLAPCLKDLKLINLNLRNTCMGNIGARALSSILDQTTLKNLNLSSNFIENEGAQALFSNPNAFKLSTLELNSNRIGDNFAKSLARLLHFSTLPALNLCNNRITRVGEQALEKAIIPGFVSSTLALNLSASIDARLKANRLFYTQITHAIQSILFAMRSIIKTLPQGKKGHPYLYMEQLNYYLPNHTPEHIKERLREFILSEFAKLTSNPTSHHTTREQLGTSQEASLKDAFEGMLLKEKTLPAKAFKGILSHYASSSWLASKWSPFSNVRSKEMQCLKKFAESLNDQACVRKQDIINILKTSHRRIKTTSTQRRLRLFQEPSSSPPDTLMQSTDKTLRSLGQAFHP